MKKEDKELIDHLRKEFIEAGNRHNVVWSEEELDKMARDLARAINNGKVLPPTIKYLRD